ARVTVTRPSPPGGTSRSEATATVQPHELFTWSMRSSASPVFVRAKVCSTFAPWSTSPKSKTGCAIPSFGCPSSARPLRGAARPSAAAAIVPANRTRPTLSGARSRSWSTVMSRERTPSRVLEGVLARNFGREGRKRGSVQTHALGRIVRCNAGADAVRVGRARDALVLGALAVGAAESRARVERRGGNAELAVVDAAVAARVGGGPGVLHGGPPGVRAGVAVGDPAHPAA